MSVISDPVSLPQRTLGGLSATSSSTPLPSPSGQDATQIAIVSTVSRNFPSTAAAKAALSVPSAPSEGVLYEPIDHRVAGTNALLSHQPVFACVACIKYSHRRRAKKLFATVTSTHLLLLAPNGAINRGVLLSEVLSLTLDNSNLLCLMTPSVASGERRWLWRWDCVGISATTFLGAVLQSRRALRCPLRFELIFAEVPENSAELNIQLKKTDKQKSIAQRRHELLSITTDEVQILYHRAQEEFEEEVAHTQMQVERWSHHLMHELEQRREERFVATIVIAAGTLAHEAAFRRQLALMLQEIGRMTVAGADLQQEIDATRLAAHHAVQQRITASAVLANNSAKKSTTADPLQLPEGGILHQKFATPAARKKGDIALQYLRPVHVSYTPDFSEVPLNDVAKPEGSFESSLSVRKERPKPGMRREAEGVKETYVSLLVTHVDWVSSNAGGAGIVCPSVADLQADFERVCGVRVSSVVWRAPGTAEIMLHAGVAYPQAVASAVRLGWVPMTSKGCRLIVDTHGSDCSDVDSFPGVDL